MYTITEIIIDMIPFHFINFLPERHNETFLMKSVLTMDRKTWVKEEIHLD